jgi:hypothetical protein
MEVHMKNLVSLLLALLMVLSTLALAACSDDTPDTTPETPSDTPSDTPSTPDADEDEPATDARLPLDLPDVYYGDGTTFHVIEWTANSNFDAGTVWLPWHECDASEEDEDLLGTAVFARNAFVEEKYGIEITQEYVNVNAGENIQRLLVDNQTGENSIQLTTARSFEAWGLVDSGLLFDMNQYAGEILHTDKPWWVQDAVASYTLGDSLYLCATEMQLRDKGATSLIFYNTQIAEDYELGYLFDMMEDGEWTMETMISACEIVAGDRDGDDLINTRADMWGVTGADDASFMLYAGAGLKFAEINEEGYLDYRFGSKDSILTMTDIFEQVMYADWYLNGYVNPLPGEGGGFGENLAFCVFSLAKSAYIDLRDEDIPFGVLPVPKYDEDQENYSSLVWMHHDSVLGIPSGAADTEMCAIILEALSYEGYYTVTPVLYDTLLYNRLAKTEEARRGFEVVFETRVYDPGQFWEVNPSFGDKVLRHTATGNAGIASLWSANESAVMAHVKTINDFIDETR